MADEPAAPATPTEPVTPAAPAPSATPPTVLGAAAEPSKAGDSPVDPKAEPPKEPAKPDAPAAIDPAAVKLPDGFKADEAALKSAADILSNDKLSPQERMQSLVDFHAAELKKASEASSKYWAEKNTEWVKEMKSEFGEDINKNPKIVAVAKMIDSMGEKLSSEFRAAIDFVGAGNNPGLVRGLTVLADRLGEPKHLQGNPPAAQAQTPASAFYPNMKQG